MFILNVFILEIYMHMFYESYLLTSSWPFTLETTWGLWFTLKRTVKSCPLYNNYCYELISCSPHASSPLLSNYQTSLWETHEAAELTLDNFKCWCQMSDSISWWCLHMSLSFSPKNTSRLIHTLHLVDQYVTDPNEAA